MMFDQIFDADAESWLLVTCRSILALKWLANHYQKKRHAASDGHSITVSTRRENHHFKRSKVLHISFQLMDKQKYHQSDP